ncbi:MAG: LptA/OstA family protein [Gammaproteobacteria bacterium]
MACSLPDAAAALALAFAALPAAAQDRGPEQDRSQLPIKVEARSSDFDYQASVLVFDQITIVQGDIRITAERARASGLDFEDSSWEFSGTVRIAMTDSNLASDSARVRFSGGRIQSATVTGSPASFEQKRDAQVAQGRANRIDYDLGRGTVELAGDAWLTDGRNEITSTTLVYSTANQRVISREPVTFTIQPRESEDGARPQQQPPAPAPKPRE